MNYYVRYALVNLAYYKLTGKTLNITSRRD